MPRFIHLASYVFAIVIFAGAALCLWALSESRRPGVSSEILMVIPGTSFLTMLSGFVLGTCLAVARHEMARVEQVVFGVLAALGVGLAVLLLLSL